MTLSNITEQDILDVQKKWADGVINIGKRFVAKEDYVAYAVGFLDSLYAFDMGKVLFKPTLASQIQFRFTKKAALSYFINGDSDFTEDKGFALMNWEVIRFDNKGILIQNDIAIVITHYT